MRQVQDRFPFMSQTTDYLESMGQIQFGARAILPGVSYVAQLIHSLLPQHITLHNVTQFGAKPGKACIRGTEGLQGRIDMEVALITGDSTFNIGFDGPLCFTVGPSKQPALVFMITPLQEGHIIEMANFAPRLATDTNHLPAVAAFIFNALPVIFRLLFLMAYVEDLPIYQRETSLSQFFNELRAAERHYRPNSNADIALRTEYYRKHRDIIENGTFHELILAAQSESLAYAHMV
jgi:hypothetical protein